MNLGKIENAFSIVDDNEKKYLITYDDKSSETVNNSILSKNERFIINIIELMSTLRMIKEVCLAESGMAELGIYENEPEYSVESSGNWDSGKMIITVERKG